MTNLTIWDCCKVPHSCFFYEEGIHEDSSCLFGAGLFVKFSIEVAQLQREKGDERRFSDVTHLIWDQTISMQERFIEHGKFFINILLDAWKLQVCMRGFVGKRGDRSHQWRRVKLRDHMMDESCQVSRPRFQEVYALKTATLAIHLETERAIYNTRTNSYITQLYELMLNLSVGLWM